MRKLSTILAAMGAAAFLAIPAVAGAAATSTNSLAYEFNGGAGTWQLQKNTAALKATVTDHGYADAGVVVDLGLADNFKGITAVTSGPMAINVWIGDGSDAFTPGQYSGANFSYGFQNPDGSFWMTAGAQAGNTLTPAQIATLFKGKEVYAWVGLVYLGQSVSGSVSSVNDLAIGMRAFSFTNNGDGTVTASGR